MRNVVAHIGAALFVLAMLAPVGIVIYVAVVTDSIP